MLFGRNHLLFDLPDYAHSELPNALFSLKPTVIIISKDTILEKFDWCMYSVSYMQEIKIEQLVL